MTRFVTQIFALFLWALAFPATVWATNGYFTHGSSIAEKGLAGAGVAYSQDTLAAANNPAGMVWQGAEFVAAPPGDEIFQDQYAAGRVVREHCSGQGAALRCRVTRQRLGILSGDLAHRSTARSGAPTARGAAADPRDGVEGTALDGPRRSRMDRRRAHSAGKIRRLLPPIETVPAAQP